MRTMEFWSYCVDEELGRTRISQSSEIDASSRETIGVLQTAIRTSLSLPSCKRPRRPQTSPTLFAHASWVDLWVQKFLGTSLPTFVGRILGDVGESVKTALVVTSRFYLPFRTTANICERQLAEGVGFEPTLRFPVNTLSKRAPSATRPPLLAALAENARAGAGALQLGHADASRLFQAAKTSCTSSAVIGTNLHITVLFYGY
jgi:hypothetical protein